MYQIANKKIKSSKFQSLKLLPHQKHLIENLSSSIENYPIYICWGMGSGKTIGACMCMSLLNCKSKILIVCDKSTVVQWKIEIEKLFSRNGCEFNELTIDIIHYEFFEQDNSPTPKSYDMTIIDEAHRFRNAWSKKSERMLHWMQLIHECKRVIFLSGTPIVHDAKSERIAFDNMMKTNEKSLSGRIFFYDPRTDPKSTKNYPKLSETVIKCYMSWAQCFTYLINRKQTFTLKLRDEDESRSRLSSSKNTYNNLLRSISNNPFPDDPSLSTKFEEMLKQMEFCDESSLKQIVYSSRKDTGVKALRILWDNMSESNSFQITGDMTLDDRAENIKKFNRKPNSVLFITDAGGQGIDLKRVDVVHIMEPAENIQDEKQIINRAVRYKSHSQPNSTVTVFRYISSFPQKGLVSSPWKKVLYESGIFHKHEMKGITRKVQYALKDIIENEENNETIDEKILRIRNDREVDIQNELEILRCESSIHV